MAEETTINKRATKTTKKVTAKKTARKAAPRKMSAPDKPGMSVGFLLLSFILLVSMAAASLYFGHQADGQINLAERLKENKGIAIEGVETTPEAAAPTNSLPNGGLVPAAVQPTASPAPAETDVETDTATSSDDTATSTENGTEDAITPAELGTEAEGASGDGEEESVEAATAQETTTSSDEEVVVNEAKIETPSE